MITKIATVLAARRYITNVLLTLDVDPNEITLGSFLLLLDDLAHYPDEYSELSKSNNGKGSKK